MKAKFKSCIMGVEDCIMGVEEMRILRSLGWGKYNEWETCKHCGGKVIFIMPKWYEEIFLGKFGTLRCTNCGKEEKI